jgi:hypothetical protein
MIALATATADSPGCLNARRGLCFGAWFASAHALSCAGRSCPSASAPPSSSSVLKRQARRRFTATSPSTRPCSARTPRKSVFSTSHITSRTAPGWYLSHFPLRSRALRVRRRLGVRPAVGEATPEYLFHPRGPERVHAFDRASG